MFEASRGRTLDQLLDEFAALREASLERLRALRLSEADLGGPGAIPSWGRSGWRSIWPPGWRTI